MDLRQRTLSVVLEEWLSHREPAAMTSDGGVPMYGPLGGDRRMDVALPSILLRVLSALNGPVGFAIAIPALAFFFLTDGLPVDILSQKLVAVTESYPLPTVPFSVLAGLLMNVGN